jgi:glycosyltransferase involved in cell wall biosynthesis
LKKNIIYISVWSISDGLSAATVIPSLNIIGQACEKIALFTIERSQYNKKNFELNENIFHYPTIGKSSVFRVAIFRLLFRTFKYAAAGNTQMIICKGSQAGAMGCLISLFTRIPFVVESYEPHSDYMADSNCWKRWGLKYSIQKLLESLQKKKALMLGCVSKNFYKKLLKEGIDSQKLKFTPCPVDADKFGFDPERRKKKRKELKIEDDETVGIYVGKFGGIYYEEESFELFSQASGFFQNFKLLIITDYEISRIKLWACKYKINIVALSSIHHNLIGDYLSAADFAFTNVKPGPSKKYCCPVKNGEYWANGLPLIIAENIGDDSDIAKNYEAGSVCNDIRSAGNSFIEIKKIMAMNNRNSDFWQKLIQENRSVSFTLNMYDAIF